MATGSQGSSSDHHAGAAHGTAAHTGREQGQPQDLLASSLVRKRSMHSQQLDAKLGQPFPESLKGAHGGRIMVAFVGQQRGRWSDASMATSGHDSLHDCLKGILNAASEIIPAESRPAILQSWAAAQPSQPVVIGFGLMQSWSAAAGPAADDGEASMRRYLGQLHRRSKSLHLLQHKVERSALLLQPLQTNQEDITSAGACLSVSMRQSIKSLATMEFRAAINGTAEVRGTSTAASLLQEWNALADVKGQIFYWPVFGPVAVCLALSALRLDLTAVVARQNHESWKLPIQPSHHVIRTLKQTTCGPALHAHAQPAYARVLDVASAPWKGAANKRLAASTHIRAVELGQDLLQQRAAGKTARAAVKFLYPSSWRRRLAEAEVPLEDMPKKSQLYVSRIRLDIVSMMWSRQCYRLNGPYFRYLTHDASPQRNMGWEVFMSSERIIQQTSVRGKKFEDIQGSALKHRLLPVSTLGHGRTDLKSKLHAVMHQTFLEYGSGEESVRAANSDVRQILTDMGVEFAIADSKDVLASYYDPSSDSHGQHVYMYPFALQVPGLLHIVDWLVKDSLQCLPWWPKWQEGCKKILQYVSGQRQRDRLVGQIRTAHADRTDIEQLAASLRRGVSRFAQWRWKSLAAASADMERIEEAVRLAVGAADGIVIQRDIVATVAIKMAIQSQFTWDASRAVTFLVDRLMKFTSWVQGCDCHEEQLIAGQKISCPFKGCRARKVAWRLDRLRDEIEADRGSLTPGQFGSVPTETMWTALTRLLAGLHLKTSWVHDPPYLVWQVELVVLPRLKCIFSGVHVVVCCLFGTHYPAWLLHGSRMVKVNFSLVIRSGIAFALCAVALGTQNDQFQADDRAKAKLFLQQFDQARGSHGRVHRVSTYLCSEEAGCLGTDLRAFAAGHPMSSALRTEVTAYQLSVLDDGAAESPHAFVSKCANRTPSSKPAFWSATVRLYQNLACAEALAPPGAASFTSLWSRWKVMGQLQTRLYLRMRPKRQTDKALLQFVYRTGHHSLADWAVLRDVAEKDLFSDRAAQPVSDVRAIQLEYLARVFAEGGTFTLPDWQHAVPGEGQGSFPGSSTDAQSSTASGSPVLLGLRAFMVVAQNVKRKAKVRTATRDISNTHTLAAQVQMLSLWNPGDHKAGQFDAFTAGQPQQMDLATLSGWDDVLKHGKRWEVEESDLQGCRSLVRGQRFAEQQWTV